VTARVLPIAVYVSAEDVRAALGCSRSLAYWHLARAAGREPGARGLLRVSVATWENYARKTFEGGEGATRAAPPARTKAAPAAPSAPVLRLVGGRTATRIPPTEPRTRRHPAA
jgi:hypothetical protein